MLFVANFKAYLTAKQTVDYLSAHLAELKALAAHQTVALCPSFTALHPVSNQIKHSRILLAAQHASARDAGAFTGDITPADLHELGCDYCLVGHSERRNYHQETNDVLAATCLQLLNNNITPILCIGESAQERAAGLTAQVLAEQLRPTLALLSQRGLPPAQLLIAYEPQWAIGSGQIPGKDDLVEIFTHLWTLTQAYHATIQSRILYGGSVSGSSRAHFAGIPHLEGFLVGRASLDFQELKKIVDYSG